MNTKKLINKILLKKIYDGESIIDIEEDVYSAIQYDPDIPIDEDGYSQGQYELSLVWRQYDNN